MGALAPCARNPRGPRLSGCGCGYCLIGRSHARGRMPDRRRIDVSQFNGITYAAKLSRLSFARPPKASSFLLKCKVSEYRACRSCLAKGLLGRERLRGLAVCPQEGPGSLRLAGSN